MNPHLRLLCLSLSSLLLSISIPSTVRAEVVISEFLAASDRILADEDGSFEDWIEIRNTGTSPVDLNGWSLTDQRSNLNAWRFPSTNLNAGSYMVVFASGKDRRLPGLPLHTNFRLSANGEYLALVKPDGVTIATEFSPTYPAQAQNVSFGYGALTTNVTLLGESAAFRILIPSSANGGSTLADAWKGSTNTSTTFDDSTWQAGTASAGYSTAAASLVGSDSLIFRYNFDAAPVSNVILDTKPSGTAKNATNAGADWTASSSDASPNSASRTGVMTFNATQSDQIRIPAGDDINLVQGGISFWMRSAGFAGTGANGATLWERRAAAGGLAMVQTNDGRIFLRANGTANVTRSSLVSAASVTDDRWHHIACNFSQELGGSIQLYIDGLPAGSTTNSGAWTWPTTGNALLGRSSETTWLKFNGAMDDVRFYGRPLTQTEVASLYDGDGGIAPSEIGLNVESGMLGQSGSLFLRAPFQVANASQINVLRIKMRYNDGFIAWVNGREVARANAPEIPVWNDLATDVHSAAFSETFNFSLPPGLLRTGANLLAVQALNDSTTSPTFFISAQLEGFGIVAESVAPVYFTTPTPGAVNAGGTKTPGPSITVVNHFPKVPTDTQDLHVTARVGAAFNAISNVVLRYKVMFAAEVAVPMSDDGLNGDGAAGDGIFGATIPASASTNGQMIRFAVTATDIAANTSRFPTFSSPTTTAEYLGTVVNPDYVESQLPVFHLFISPQQTAGVDTETGGRIAVFYNGDFYDNVYMELRGNTTAGLPKKSHRVEFLRDAPFKHPGPGGSVYKASFMAEHLDPTYLRQNMSFWLLNETGTKAPFYYPVRLQLNGAFYQLASHTDAMSREMVERFGYDGDGALYKAVGLVDANPPLSTGGFQKLEPDDSNTSDFQALVTAINEARPVGLRRTNAFDVLDLPNVVNYIAWARWVQEGDDIWANMSVYRDTYGTREWRVIPFDMNLSWGSLYYGDNPTANLGVVSTNDLNKSHPLYGSSAILADGGPGGAFNRIYDIIIQVPELRQMLLRRMRSIMDEWIQSPETHPLNRKFEAYISYHTNRMWNEAFLDRKKWGWPDNGGPYGLGSNQWITNSTQELLEKFIQPRRVHWFVTHSATNTARPIGIRNNQNAGIPTSQPADVVIEFGPLEFSPSSGNQSEEWLCLTNPNPFAVDISQWKLRGAVQFEFQGGTVIPSNSVLYVSPDVFAFRSRTQFPKGGQGLFVQGGYRGQLSARGELLELWDASGTRKVSEKTYNGNPSLAQQYLRITEIMHAPAPAPAGSPYSDSDFEYIELRNTGPVALNLAGVHFTNAISFQFTGSAVTSLAPGASVVIVHNIAAFQSRFGNTATIAGVFTGLLNNAGERITLHDAVGEVIQDFSYSDSWFKAGQGLGFSLVIQDDTLPYDAWNLASSWRLSSRAGGSPGSVDPNPVNFPIVFINEVRANGGAGQGDAVEIHNAGTAPADISSWYLTDDFLTPKKYRLPANRVIAAGGYLTIPESEFNSGPVATRFALGSNGDDIYLFSANAAGDLTGYYHGFSYGPSDVGTTLGRFVDSQGVEHVVIESTPTLGAANAGPAIGPVILSEIQYHPSSTRAGFEYVELRNITGSEVKLYDVDAPTNTWRLRGDTDFDFPRNQSIQAGQSVLVVGFDPADAPSMAAFKLAYPSLASGAVLYGPMKGSVPNEGGSVRLQKPITVTVDTAASYLTLDRADYSDRLPWPAFADGFGPSLHRVVPATFGNDPTAWRDGYPTPGRSDAPVDDPEITAVSTGTQIVAGLTLILTAQASSLGETGYQWLFNGSPIEGGTQPRLEVANVGPNDAGAYSLLVYNEVGTALTAPAPVEVLLPAFFAFQPQSRSLPAGTNVTLSATAVGTGSISYQWRRNGVILPGRTSSSLVLTGLRVEDSGTYDVIARDLLGDMISNPASLVVFIKPVFVTSLQPLTVLQGQSANLFVQVTASGPITYRWSRASRGIVTNVTDRTTDILSLSNLQLTNGGSFSVTVSNIGGTLTSTAALTVLADFDRDGMADIWESQFGFNTNLVSDALLDKDNDGVPNRDEYEAGTDPSDASNNLRLTISPATTGVQLGFVAPTNRSFSLVYRTNLTDSSWSKFSNVASSNRVRQILLLDTNRTDIERYYQLRVPAEP